MKKLRNSDIAPLLFIAAIGFFELLYRKNLIDGCLALGMALIFFIYQISQTSDNTIYQK
ncbi:MAG: hypothetical protein ACH350_09625 [Parachlamydiaceae bacterium]